MPSEHPGTDRQIPPSVFPSNVPSDLQEYLGDQSLYFTLPSRLLDALVASIGEQEFEPSVLAADRRLSHISGDHSSRIGFYRGQPILFDLLRNPSEPNFNEDQLRVIASWGKTPQEVATTLRAGTKLLDESRRVAQGYLGWLLTNPEFHAEHDRLITANGTKIYQWGMPGLAVPVHEASKLDAQIAPPAMQQFFAAYDAFYVRWRLERLAVPLLPIPLRPQYPVVDTRPLLSHVKEGGKTFFIPDIFTLPTRDEFRQLVEDLLREASAPAHLHEWMSIVHHSNAAKNKISKYARVFEVQHYLRILHGRYADVTRSQKPAVVRALAAFLDVTTDTIDSAMKLIADCIGTDLTA